MVEAALALAVLALDLQDRDQAVVEVVLALEVQVQVQALVQDPAQEVQVLEALAQGPLDLDLVVEAEAAQETLDQALALVVQDQALVPRAVEVEAALAVLVLD
jgi:hypothetical protein